MALGRRMQGGPRCAGSRGSGGNWRLFVRLLQVVWRTGRIPQKLLWTIVVLWPKVGGDYRGIGLLEPIWKVMEAIMD